MRGSTALRAGDEPAAAAAAGSHRHARLSRAVSRAGADVKRRDSVKQMLTKPKLSIVFVYSSA